MKYPTLEITRVRWDCSTEARAMIMKINGKVVNRHKPYHCRSVFFYRGFAIKLDLGRNPEQYEFGEGDYYEWTENQNALELERWKTITPYDRRYFPKIYTSGELHYKGLTFPYLIQERIRGYIRKSMTEKEQKIVDRLTEKYDLDDVYHFDGDTRSYSHAEVTNIAGWNCAVIGGRLVIFDFAG